MPNPCIGVVLSGTVVGVRKPQERLLLLAVVAVAVGGERGRAVVPAFAERIVVAALHHLAFGVQHDADTAQVVGEKVHRPTGRTGSCFRRHETSPVETPAVQRQRITLLTIFLRAQIVEGVAGGVLRRELRAIRKIAIFRDNRISALHFFNQVQTSIYL